MQYDSGYPEPEENSGATTIDGTDYGPGDQFRFPNGTNPLTDEETFGLCYVLRTSEDSVTFFNVSEEMRVTHDEGELRGAELHKLDEKWSETDG